MITTITTQICWGENTLRSPYHHLVHLQILGELERIKPNGRLRPCQPKICIQQTLINLKKKKFAKTLGLIQP